ncbi:MAG: hypothetical protein P4N41_07445 [Negativicutes bacterium]|nr:hypothetical protein [Negativicutes bacterium]
MARAGGRPHGALHPDTFNELQCDEAAQIAQLRTVDQQLGLTLQPAQLVLPGATLKRAQVSRYDGTPIAQITYLIRPLAPWRCVSPSANTARAQRLPHRNLA